MLIRGFATGTLDTGKCPPWLFKRMKEFCRIYFQLSTAEIGIEETLKRLADPVWFQSFGCVVGFDWNASGLTTTLTAAIKEAIKPLENELGWTVCGGKGKLALKTPQEIIQVAEKWGINNAQTFVNLSRLTAKIDNTLIQDGFQIYHHTFFLSRNGYWIVIQQGMNTSIKRARRYHWGYISDHAQQLLNDPHKGIAGTGPSLPNVLNLASSKSHKNRAITIEWLNNKLTALKDLKLLLNRPAPPSFEITRLSGNNTLITSLNMGSAPFKTHPVLKERPWQSPYFLKLITKLLEHPPQNYIQLLMTTGVGPLTIRALALIAELLYGAPPSYQDPQRYTFAHGGKDGIPFPVNKRTYDETIDLLRKTLHRFRSDITYRKKVSSKLISLEKSLEG